MSDDYELSEDEREEYREEDQRERMEREWGRRRRMARAAHFFLGGDGCPDDDWLVPPTIPSRIPTPPQAREEG